MVSEAMVYESTGPCREGKSRRVVLGVGVNIVETSVGW